MNGLSPETQGKRRIERGAKGNGGLLRQGKNCSLGKMFLGKGLRQRAQRAAPGHSEGASIFFKDTPAERGLRRNGSKSDDYGFIEHDKQQQWYGFVLDVVLEQRRHNRCK
jgi:hypothetical protein